MTSRTHTHAVSDSVFREVYDSPAALPGRYKWLTSDGDVREIERLLEMPAGTIGAPLWVSGDRKTCAKCRRQLSWLDIVSSALGQVHARSMIAQVILGEQKYVNTEAPRAIAGVKCHACGAAFDSLRSFKCHNWAYAKGAILRLLQRTERRGK